jgi:CRP-like cAMP-binding protein
MDLDRLRQTALFASLDDAELASVAAISREQHYHAADAIFREGEPGNRLFLIVSGSVRVSRHISGIGEEALAVLRPGESFGELSVFDRSDRSTDAWSNEATVVAVIARADLERLLESDHDLAYKVLRNVVHLLAARLRASNDSLRAFLAMSMF